MQFQSYFIGETALASSLTPDETTSHSTRLSAEELLAGHPKDDSQVAGYSRAKDTPTLTLPRRERGRLLLPPPGEGWDEGGTACVVRFASRSMRSIGNRTAYPLRVQPPCL